MYEIECIFVYLINMQYNGVERMFFRLQMENLGVE